MNKTQVNTVFLGILILGMCYTVAYVSGYYDGVSRGEVTGRRQGVEDGIISASAPVDQ